MNMITPRNTIGHPDATRYYAGIGSRSTPADQISAMETIGRVLGDHGWHLRSGFADGADQAFYRGARDSQMGVQAITNFIPWGAFNGAPGNAHPQFIVPELSNELMNIAAQAHPNWRACTPAVKRLHARNVCQVLGEDPGKSVASKMVICWTPEGKGGGGTGQALRIASLFGIPVFDIARESDREALAEFVDHN